MVVPGVGRQESETPRQPPRVATDALRLRHTQNGTTTIPNFPQVFFVARAGRKTAPCDARAEPRISPQKQESPRLDALGYSRD